MASDYLSCPVAGLLESGSLAINDGYRAKNSELAAAGIPFARAGNIDGGFHFAGADCVPPATLSRVGVKISEPGDVVFTSKGTVGRFAFVRNDTPRFVYSPQLCFWRVLDSNRIFPRWLYYWMNSREFFLQFKGVAGQTDMAEYVSLRDQRTMRLTLPPLPEQKRIAHVLGTLDDKIELNRRMNATLEAMSRAIFKSWFVDFDPVRQKAAGKQPVGMNAETAALFPDSFEDSELGEVPTGWEVRSFSELCSAIYSGGTPSTKEPAYWNGSFGWLSSGETREPFIIETDKTITQEGIDNSSTRFAKANSTVIASAGQGHTRGQASMLKLDTFINQSVVCMKANEEIISDVYLFFDTKRRYGQFRQISDSHSSRGSLTTKLLASVKAVKPPSPLVDSFTKTTDSAVAIIDNNLRESRTLAALRDTLLPKLLSGEIRVPEAEEAVEEAVG